jgi:purine-binding chemotaxis protein CheW
MAEINKSSEQTHTSRSLQIVVFKLGNEEYGLQIDQIKEVVITPTITKMPQTSSYVKGVANIRGNVIAIFDLEDRFNLTRTIQSKGSKYTLVVESEDIKLGLLVSEVPKTVSVNSSDLDESVGIINDANAETNYIKGIIKSGERLIILIDIFKVIDHEMTNQLKKATATAA